ncbi:MAG: HD domain-containing protein [Dehalobacterium sp.]
MEYERLKRQIQFIMEIDKLKHILRQTLLIDGSRRENDAEHSWHIAVMAVLLSEYSSLKEIDVLRVIKLVLVHDLVEIDAGDVYCYDQGVNQDSVKQQEKNAAVRLFNLLPEDQAEEFFGLWEEFEKRITPEARFAASLDRLQPLLHDYNTKGVMWKRNHVKGEQVMVRNKVIADGSEILWEYAKGIIESSVENGFLQP